MITDLEYYVFKLFPSKRLRRIIDEYEFEPLKCGPWKVPVTSIPHTSVWTVSTTASTSTTDSIPLSSSTTMNNYWRIVWTSATSGTSGYP